MKSILRCLVATVAALMLPAIAMAEVAVEDAWIPLAPPGTVAHAGYVRLINRGDAVRTVVGVSAAGFAQVMIHRTVEEGGMARMEHMDELPLPVGQEVLFEPGGLHVMFIAPQRPMTLEQAVTVQMALDDGSKFDVVFKVRPR